MPSNIMIAVQNENIPEIERLCANEFNSDYPFNWVRSQEYRDAFMFNIMNNGNLDVIEIMLNIFSPHRKKYIIKDVIKYCFNTKNSIILEKIIQFMDNPSINNNKLIWKALNTDDNDLIRVLLNHPKINKRIPPRLIATIHLMINS